MQRRRQALAKDSSGGAATSVSGVIDASIPAAARKEAEKGVAALNGGGKEKTLEATRHFEKAIEIYRC